MAPFIRIPSSWLGHPAVGPAELAVLVALAGHADRQGRCWPAQSTLAARLGRSRAWVAEAIGRLEAAGLIERHQRHRPDGGLSSCVYRLPDLAALTGSPDPAGGVTEACPPTDSPRQPADRIQNPEELKINTRAPATAGTAENPNERAPEPATEPALPIAPDWTPDTQTLVWASQAYPDANLDEHTQIFVNRSLAKGYRFKNADAAWRTWLIENQQRQRQRLRRTAKGSAHDVLSRRLAAWAEIAQA